MKTHNIFSPADSASNDDAAALARAFDQSHIDVEAEKDALARTLHDDIGGLLVGVIMDMGWVANQPHLADAVKEKLARAQGLLRVAIDMTRDLVEDLKPTLLDNVGLYPTLRWHIKASCDAARIPYTESFPLAESRMAPEVRVGVFRIFQEALKEVLSQRTPTGRRSDRLRAALSSHPSIGRPLRCRGEREISRDLDASSGPACGRQFAMEQLDRRATFAFAGAVDRPGHARMNSPSKSYV